MIYPPQEDSYLLLKHIKDYAKKAKLVLDIGTGSGILAEEAAEYADSVIAVDIDKKATDYCKKNIKRKNIKFVQSNLFSYFNNKKIKFDLIIFNPPYLPKDSIVKDRALDGGKKGHEIIKRFLKNAKRFLNKNGKILLLFSSLTNKNEIEQVITENKFKYRQIDSQKFFFEELFVYELCID